MTLRVFRALLVRPLPLLLQLSVLAALSIGSAGASESARYELALVATWSETSHPNDFPAGAHLSGLIGASHSDRVDFWTPGALASPGIERMAELGAKSPLEDEVATAIAAGDAGALISGGGIGQSPGQVSVEITVGRAHPAITVVSMIAPSPDWFVGVHGLSLLRGDDWVELEVVELFAYDAGTDSGPSYESANQDTQPREAIRRIDEAPFTPGVPVGQLVLRRLDGPELPALDLREGRFRAMAAWAAADGTRGVGRPATITDDTGYFWFFQEGNTEVLVKLLLGCFLNDRYWVFAGGLTNLEVDLLIEDTESREVRGYVNPLGRPFRPIQDTAAFATCP